MDARSGGTVRLTLILGTSLVFVVFILSSASPLTVLSQTGPDVWWETLAGNPYRTAYVQASIMSGAITGTEAWSFDPSLYSALGYYPFDSNPLIVDIDGKGGSEVVVVNSGGVLMVLNGATTNTGGELLGYLWVNAEPHSTPAAADLDGDGLLEIVVGTKEGRVVALDISATWSINYLWESERLDERISTSPLVVDLDGDGLYEVVVQLRSGLVCLDGSTGSIVWRATVEDMVFVQSPVLLGDINGDGKLDVLGVGGFGEIYAVSGLDGSIIWEKNLWKLDPSLEGLFIVHTPLVADTDGDSVSEIVVSLGREVFGRPNRVERTGLVGSVAILDSGNGALEAVISPGGAVLYAWFAQPALAAGDIDNDGMAEIFLASADGKLYEIQYSGNGYSTTSVLTFDADWNTPAMGPTSAGIAIADVDNDGSYEVVLIGTAAGNKNLDYEVYIYNVDTGTSTNIYTFSVAGERFNWPSLSMGDADGDGSLEIVVVATHMVICLE